jgi:adenylate cyclase
MASETEQPPRTASWRDRVEAAFRREQLRSQEIGFRLVVVVFPIIAVWVTVENGLPGALSFYPLLAFLAVLLVAPYVLTRLGRFAPWHDYVFAALYVLLVAALTFTRPLSRFDVPVQFFLTMGNEVYLFAIIAAAVFTFSPRVVLWTGIVSAAIWSAITLWVLWLPDTVGSIPDPILESLTHDERLRLMSDPHRVHVGRWIRTVVAIFTVTAALAAFVRMARGVVFRQAQAERERANLSRYFSQNMVDELAHADEPLGPTRRQEVAVLFADIVGFTAWSASRAPDEVIEMLREFHGRMERAIFAHGGTVDKYIGDAVMATFGTPRPGATDALSALRCVREMVAAVDSWNAERRARGLDAIGAGIGAHYGPVVLGDIGGNQRLEFAVLGDTVNVASRLEHLTRPLNSVAVISDDLVRAARRGAEDLETLLAGFRFAPQQPLRGRDERVDVWTLAVANADAATG